MDGVDGGHGRMKGCNGDEGIHEGLLTSCWLARGTAKQREA